MKCDHLIGRKFNGEVYILASDVTEAIVELKAKNKRLEEFKDKYKDCAKKAIDNIAKCELKIRRLSRALYKACANWAELAQWEGFGLVEN